MTCGHFVAAAAGCDRFTVDASRVTFGRGALLEVGERARVLGMRRVGCSRSALAAPPWFAEVERARGRRRSSRCSRRRDRATDASFEDAARVRAGRRVDGYVSLGGGSVIDTAKAANLFATHPAPLRAYVNAPIGEAPADPRAARAAHRVPDDVRHRQRGHRDRDLRPARARTPRPASRRRSCARPRPSSIRGCTATLPANVVAASGLDVMCHAIESYTARPFTAAGAGCAGHPAREPGRESVERPRLSRGHGADRALPRARGARDATDTEARQQMMWAATLAGIASATPASTCRTRWRTPSPAGSRDYRRGYPVRPARAARLRGRRRRAGGGARVRRVRAGAPPRGGGAARRRDRGAARRRRGRARRRVRAAARGHRRPNGIAGVGCSAADIGPRRGRFAQQRLLANAPCDVDAECLASCSRCHRR